MKEFTFRLGKAKPDEFWQSVKTARVKERIVSEKYGEYELRFYQDNGKWVVGVAHLLLTQGEPLDVARFELLPLGDGLKVIVEYSTHQAYAPYLAGLFQEIAKDWKEIQPEINGVILELGGKPTPTYDAAQFEYEIIGHIDANDLPKVVTTNGITIDFTTVPAELLNLTLPEIERRAKAGDIQARESLNKFMFLVYHAFKPFLDVHEELSNDPDAKPVYGMIQRMLQSENPVHRATIALVMDPEKSLLENLNSLRERAGKELRKEIEQSSKILPGDVENLKEACPAPVERIKQPFNGTKEELKRFVMNFIVDHAPRTPRTVGPSDYLTLRTSLDNPDSFPVVREIAHEVQDHTGTRLVFDPNPPHEGTIEVRQVTINPPHAEFICIAHTEACKQLAQDLQGEIVNKGLGERGQSASLPGLIQNQIATGSLPPDISFAEIDSLKFDIAKAKQKFPDFSVATAIRILKVIPEARKTYDNELSPGQWGPKWIASKAFNTVSTVSNYLRVLYLQGLRTVDDIPIPHRLKKPTK